MLEPPAFLPELLNTPERILSKNGLRFTHYNIAWQRESLTLQSIAGKRAGSQELVTLPPTWLTN